MAKQKAPKPLVPVAAGGVPYTDSTPEDASVAIAKAAAKKKRRTASATNKAKNIKEGFNTRVPVTFWFANSKSQIITMPYKHVIAFAIVTPKKAKNALDADVQVEGNKITGRKRGQALQSVAVSYGRKSVARKKAGKNGAAGAKVQVQAWVSFSIPKSATLKDLLQFVSTWRKQPALIRYKGEDIMLDVNRAIGGAGAAR